MTPDRCTGRTAGVSGPAGPRRATVGAKRVIECTELIAVDPVQRPGAAHPVGRRRAVPGPAAQHPSTYTAMPAMPVSPMRNTASTTRHAEHSDPDRGRSEEPPPGRPLLLVLPDRCDHTEPCRQYRACGAAVS